MKNILVSVGCAVLFGCAPAPAPAPAQPPVDHSQEIRRLSIITSNLMNEVAWLESSNDASAARLEAVSNRLSAVSAFGLNTADNRLYTAKMEWALEHDFAAFQDRIFGTNSNTISARISETRLKVDLIESHKKFSEVAHL